MRIVLEFIVKYWVELLASVCGSCGFCLFFHVKRDKLLFGIIGGLIAIVTLFISDDLGLPILVQNMFAAMLATLYSEVIARVVKAPATVFIISSIIPLTPGGSLYYTMNAVVEQNAKDFEDFGTRTGLTALGIALGIVFISVIFYQINHMDVKQKVNYRKYEVKKKIW